MALVIVMRFVCALLVIGLLVLILWIFEALIKRGLEGLVVALGETLAVIVFMFVGMIVTTMVVVIPTNIFLVVITTM